MRYVLHSNTKTYELSDLIASYIGTFNKDEAKAVSLLEQRDILILNYKHGVLLKKVVFSDTDILNTLMEFDLETLAVNNKIYKRVKLSDEVEWFLDVVTGVYVPYDVIYKKYSQVWERGTFTKYLQKNDIKGEGDPKDLFRCKFEKELVDKSSDAIKRLFVLKYAEYKGYRYKKDCKCSLQYENITLKSWEDINSDRGIIKEHYFTTKVTPSHIAEYLNNKGIEPINVVAINLIQDMYEVVTYEKCLDMTFITQFYK